MITTFTMAAAGAVHAILVWYDMFHDCADSPLPFLSTGPSPQPSTSGPAAHWRQVACMLEEPVQVAQGQMLRVTCVCSTIYGLHITACAVAV